MSFLKSNFNKVNSTYSYLLNFFKKSIFTEMEFNNIKTTEYQGESSEPVVGYKVAFISNLFDVVFTGYSFGKYHSLDTYSCMKLTKNNHKTFFQNCRCGFHSFKNLDDALSLLNLREGGVILEVENYGDIIEYEKGYKSEIQEVISVLIPQECFRIKCKNPTEFLSFKYKKFMNTCSDHKGKIYHHLNDLRSQLPFEINYLNN